MNVPPASPSLRHCINAKGYVGVQLNWQLSSNHFKGCFYSEIKYVAVSDSVDPILALKSAFSSVIVPVSSNVL